MNDNERILLESVGWVIVCENPIEIAHSDGSIATGQTVDAVIQMVIDQALYEDGE